MEQASVKKDEIRRALDVVMATSIVPVVLGVALIYAIFCVAHLLVLPPGRAEIMASLAGGSALVCGVMYWAMLRWELPPRLAHPSGFVVALIMLGNTLTHLYLEGDPLETTNLLLVILGVSCVFLSPAWAGAVGGLAVGAGR